MMRTGLLSLAIVSVFTISVQAQLASDRYSPINYIGRFAGFGYSDGYHSCKTEQCNPRGTWKDWGPMSVMYGTSTVASPRSTTFRSMVAPSPHAVSQYQDIAQTTDVPQAIGASETHQPMQTMQSSPQTFQPPLTPSSQSQSSPSDIRKPPTAPSPKYDELPAPSLPSKPQTLPSKPQSETRSIIRPSAFRL